MGNFTALESACAPCDEVAFLEYTPTGTKRHSVRSDTIWFSLCGAALPCLTNPAEVQAAIAAGTFKIVTCGRVNLGASTPNTETNDLGCADSEDVTDYTKTATFRFAGRLENDAFWEQICKGKFDHFGWVTCNPSHFTFCPSSLSGFSAQVEDTDNNDFWETTGTITWTQECGIIDKLETHSSVFDPEHCCN